MAWNTPPDISRFINGMASRRGEILTSLIDKEIIGGLKEPEKAEEAAEATGPEGLGAVQQEPRDEQDLVAEEYIDEEDELLKELEESSVEMDAMSEVEKDILESFAREKEAAQKVSESDIMAGVGVEKGVPEAAQDIPEGPAETEAVPEAVVEKIIVEQTKQEANPPAEQKSTPAEAQESAPEKPQQKEAPIKQEQTKKPGKDE